MASGDERRMPRWMYRPVIHGGNLRKVENVLSKEGLYTVCVGARCPNKGECFASGTATFMIMGDTCTRGCGFCAVPTGPVRPLDEGEPEAVARAAVSMGLSHVVVTSVTRDDVPDGGASHFARTIREVRKALPDATVEVLIPDFEGSAEALETVFAAMPDVLNHNVETVKELYSEVRPRSEYSRSLDILSAAGKAGLLPKSGFMVGLSESPAQIGELLDDLKRAGCRFVTVGQYLQPAKGKLPVQHFWKPEEFMALEARAVSMGFEGVAAGPLVRSSYYAGQMLEQARRAGGQGN